MQKIVLIVIAFVVLASGCRTTETPYERKPYQPKLLTQRTAPADELAQRSPTARSSPSLSRRPDKQTRPGGRVERLPEIRAATERQVDFQQPVQELPEHRPDDSELHQPPSTEPIPRPAASPSLENFERMALANNPTLVEAQARVDAAQGRWLQVGLKPNPRMGYVAEEMGDDGTLGKQGGFIGQQFVTGGKLRLNRAIVDQEIALAEQELAAQQFRVLTDVRLAYYDFLIAVRRGDLAENLLRYTKTIQDDTQKLLEGGEAKRSDLLRAQIEVRSIEVVIRDAEFQKQAAWKTLIAVLGTPQLEMPTVNDAMRLDAKMILEEAARRGIDHHHQLDRILASSPEIAAAMANVEAARWSVDRAYAEVVPNVNAQVALQGDNATGDTLVGVQLSLPIPIWNRNQGGIRQAQAQVVEAERFADRIALRLIQRFEVVYQRYLNAKYQVEQYTKTGDADEDKGILVKAQESIDLNQRLLRAGEIKNLEMFVAQQVYTQANLAYLDTVRELWASILEIEGLLLKDSFAK